MDAGDLELVQPDTSDILLESAETFREASKSVFRGFMELQELLKNVAQLCVSLAELLDEQNQNDISTTEGDTNVDE